MSEEIDHTTWNLAMDCADKVINLLKRGMGEKQEADFDSLVDHHDKRLLLADHIQTYFDKCAASMSAEGENGIALTSISHPTISEDALEKMFDALFQLRGLGLVEASGKHAVRRRQVGVAITISKEHLDIAMQRKRRSEGKA